MRLLLAVLGILILASGWALFGVVLPAQSNGRYKMTSANDNNIFLIDTRTGRCWRKFVDSSGGPTHWTEDSPAVSRPEE